MKLVPKVLIVAMGVPLLLGAILLSREVLSGTHTGPVTVPWLLTLPILVLILAQRRRLLIPASLAPVLSAGVGLACGTGLVWVADYLLAVVGV